MREYQQIPAADLKPGQHIEGFGEVVEVRYYASQIARPDEPAPLFFVAMEEPTRREEAEVIREEVDRLYQIVIGSVVFRRPDGKQLARRASAPVSVRVTRQRYTPPGMAA